MNVEARQRNQAIWRFLLLPLLFLTVALLGGLRVGAEKENFIFIAPPLVCLILAALLMFLFLRGRLLILNDWISHDFPLLTNVANALIIVALFFASAQALNSVLPESGFLFWLFGFFFLWTLWNNLFSEFDAKRLLRSLAVLFGTAFLLKHLLLAAFSAPQESFWWKVTNLLFDDMPRNFFGFQNFAPATGYISFFALALYVLGLVSLPFVSEETALETEKVRRLTSEIAELTPHELELLREEISRKSLQPENKSLASEEQI